MANPYGITLDDHSLRWAAAEGVPEAVIATICLLGQKSIDGGNNVGRLHDSQFS